MRGPFVIVFPECAASFMHHELRRLPSSFLTLPSSSSSSSTSPSSPPPPPLVHASDDDEWPSPSTPRYRSPFHRANRNEASSSTIIVGEAFDDTAGPPSSVLSPPSLAALFLRVEHMGEFDEYDDCHDEDLADIDLDAAAIRAMASSSSSTAAAVGGRGGRIDEDDNDDADDDDDDDRPSKRMRPASSSLLCTAAAKSNDNIDDFDVDFDVPSTFRDDMTKALIEHFGHATFRDGQLEVLHSVMSGRDACVFWATGRVLYLPRCDIARGCGTPASLHCLPVTGAAHHFAFPPSPFVYRWKRYIADA